jgi:D-alanyl-D-alanine carboxypeptidase (penicillin-binding protein 5/6)
VRRYSYTPRRNGRQTGTSRGAGAGSGSVLPFALPVVVLLATIVGVIWLAGGSGASCQGTSCNSALALAPTPTALRAVASPTPRPAPAPPPQITGLAAAILEEPCGKTVYAFNEHATYPPASLTKMMTALVAAQKGDMSQLVTSPIDGGQLSAATDGTVVGLKVGQQLTLRDLLYGLMLRSGNDAALAIAVAIGGGESGFAQMMNDEAKTLGLTDTNFTNPHGLDDPHLYTSAYDIARIGIELLRNPDLAQIVKTQEYTPLSAGWTDGSLKNINLFLTQYPGAIGVKTGYTDTAGQTIVGAAERDGRTLLVSVMHSGDEYVDAGALLDWAFGNTAPACGPIQATASPAASQKPTS